MENIIKIGDREITLSYEDSYEKINVDDLTKIDHSNLFGEVVTVSTATNRIGILKSELESAMAEVRLEEKIYIGEFIASLRKQASLNMGKYTVSVGGEDIEVKLTEKGLETVYHTDKRWQELRKRYIETEKNFNILNSLYWSMQDKSRKLNNFLNGVTPEDFVSEIVEGKINGILLKK